ncbi:hypothetical protein [Streptomyces sp. MZ04]|uniref:hypothetical protein n=1 Tax=Streptomyces sp. MZ04 TaxID=2559236 RepID=UPI00143340D7|nr:hypothetical protein [Streptomyces sp. MZ04]
MRRRARALLAEVWEMFVIFGRITAGERPPEGAGQGSRASGRSRRSRPSRPAGPSGPPATLPGHPERVPPANESSPENRAFWTQVARMTDEILPRGRRGPHK